MFTHFAEEGLFAAYPVKKLEAVSPHIALPSEYSNIRSSDKLFLYTQTKPCVADWPESLKNVRFWLEVPQSAQKEYDVCEYSGNAVALTAHDPVPMKRILPLLVVLKFTAQPVRLKAYPLELMSVHICPTDANTIPEYDVRLPISKYSFNPFVVIPSALECLGSIVS